MQGYDVHDKPGYDCHGLPIEVRVEETLGIKSKRDIERIGVQSFIEKCKDFVRKHQHLQTEIFDRLGVWMDWENPYLTYLNDYIESAWWTLKKAEEKDLLAKGLKIVHWCPRCETALAGYEITDEYRVVRDPSIYVKFPVVGRENERILIWTTTPWTLPANVAVMIHPEHMYVRAKVRGEVLILAEERCEPVFSELGLEYEVVERFKGRTLEGLRYRHPLLEEVPLHSRLKDAHFIILSEEFVTLEEGTGCVHCAPGHGEEDFEAGSKYGLPVVSPLDSTGRFVEEGGKYAGMYARAANKVIIDDLRKKDLLLSEATVDHKYPHCWRCKTPLLLRATEQWFIKVTRLKQKLLEENEKIRWIPDRAGSRRFKDWLAGARDWVISRQRYWGIPLPIWVCERCGRYEVIGSSEELRSRTSLPEALDLHKPWIDDVILTCKCGGLMRRVPDVLDVWMDSGVAAWASIGYPKREEGFRELWPSDLIIEAHDQTRGWFYSQLVSGLVAFKTSPYRTVIVHGHTLDEKGRKLSKSLGTFISPDQIVSKYGSDALRLYELRCTLWEDFCFKEQEVASALATLNIMWNIYNFASTYMRLDGFDPHSITLKDVEEHLRPEDRWILSSYQRLVKDALELMGGYRIHEVARLLCEFMVEDLSRWYIKLIRRRVWIEEADPKKLAVYATLYTVLKGYLALIAPFTPFIAEAIWQRMMRPLEPDLPESIHLCDLPRFDERLIDEGLEEGMSITKEVVSATLRLRQKAKLKVRLPVRKVIMVPSDEKVIEALSIFEQVVREQVNCKTLEVLPVRGKPAVPESFPALKTARGEIYLDATRAPELMAEYWAREVVRRIQLMRKERDLSVEEYVDLTVLASNDEIAKALSEMRDYISEETRAKELRIAVSRRMEELPPESYKKSWTINGEQVLIGLRTALKPSLSRSA